MSAQLDDASALQTIAAADLGSNSFHLIVARRVDGRIQIVDRIKEMVRLAAGLDEHGDLTEEAIVRALECLERFGQRLRWLPPSNVVAVGTNTLRRAHNRDAFLERAQSELGHPIHLVSGREEARLIYQGVHQSLDSASTRRLVIDIGGGSTELIIGQRAEAIAVESLHIGCVSSSQRFFADAKITAKRWEEAMLSAAQELEPVERHFRPPAWEVAFGASGTIRSVAHICTELGYPQDTITREALDAIRKRLVAAGNAQRVDLPGLSANRRPVFPGGLAILTALFDALQIDEMRAARGALREGLLYTLLGRMDDIDVREHTVSLLMERYRVDRSQAARVENTATRLFHSVASGWKLDVATYAPLVRWAARLHEIGLDISHTQFHKHGAYLLAHMDMPGFTQHEQARLGVLVRSHRRKFPLAEFAPYPGEESNELIRLAMLLRIATLIHRNRADEAMPDLVARAEKKRLVLEFDPIWLEAHPLTRLDLAQEQDFLAAAGLCLKVRTATPK